MVATLKGSFGQTTLEAVPHPYTIGRAPDNQLLVNDSKASSHHAQIRYEGQGYEVIDLGSRNGTYVNGQQLVPHVPHLLSVNDQIRIGDTTFVFEADAMPSLSSQTSQAA
ncbi:MAG TPA: FHA domain-containing protein, partial [Ktedonobacteraceae bacterium]|nr:FHA domain-containing protein [Ktedonobacteraceae bacterium]